MTLPLKEVGLDYCDICPGFIFIWQVTTREENKIWEIVTVTKSHSQKHKKSVTNNDFFSLFPEKNEKTSGPWRNEDKVNNSIERIHTASPKQKAVQTDLF